MFVLSTKTTKVSCTIASILLLLVGLFHGSGMNYINDLVQNSDVSQLVKDIFPVLFILPSFQLIGLGIVGLLAIKQPINRNILVALSIFVLIDSILAFWLNAIIPGLVLLTPSLIYLVAAWNGQKKMSS